MQILGLRDMRTFPENNERLQSMDIRKAICTLKLYESFPTFIPLQEQQTTSRPYEIEIAVLLAV